MPAASRKRVAETSPPPSPSAPAGVLSVVATPLGNLEDITARALRVLRACDLIAAEDTRVTRKLLAHFDIHTPLASHHAHSSPAQADALLGRLLAGQWIALVSDAGTPAISDPGAEPGRRGHRGRGACRAGPRPERDPGGPGRLRPALRALHLRGLPPPDARRPPRARGAGGARRAHRRAVRGAHTAGRHPRRTGQGRRPGAPRGRGAQPPRSSRSSRAAPWPRSRRTTARTRRAASAPSCWKARPRAARKTPTATSTRKPCCATRSPAASPRATPRATSPAPPACLATKSTPWCCDCYPHRNDRYGPARLPPRAPRQRTSQSDLHRAGGGRGRNL